MIVNITTAEEYSALDQDTLLALALQGDALADEALRILKSPYVELLDAMKKKDENK